MFSGLVNYRQLIAASCAAAVAAGTLAAPAQAAVDPLGRECRTATAAANMGQPIPNIGKYLLSSNENAIDNGVLRIYAPEKYKPYITQATNQWANATGGLMRFEYVDQPGYKVVTVREANLGGYVVGRVQGTVNNMELLLNPDILRNGYIESLVMTITHELGHAMGLAHSCDGALMKDGTNRGKVAKTPQPLDVQVLIQANNLREYANRPSLSTSTSPSTTTTPPPSPEPTPTVTVVPSTTPAVSSTTATGAITETTPPSIITVTVVPEPTTEAAASTEPTTPASAVTTTAQEVGEAKPASLSEAQAAVRDAEHRYIAALSQGDDAEISAAVAALVRARENLAEYQAAHPEELSKPSTTPTSETAPTTSTTSTPISTTSTSTAPVLSSSETSAEATTSVEATTSAPLTTVAWPQPSTLTSTSQVTAVPTTSATVSSETTSATVSAKTTTSKPAPSSTTSVLSSAATSAEKTSTAPVSSTTARATSVASTSPAKQVIDVTGENHATTVNAWPTKATQTTPTTEPATPAAPPLQTTSTTSTTVSEGDVEGAATESSTSGTAPVTTTDAEYNRVNVHIGVVGPAQTEKAEADEAESVAGSSAAAVLIPLIVLILAALGAGGWAYMNGMI